MEKPQRSSRQNRSAHKYFTEIANELEAQGITRTTIVEDLAETGVPITPDFIKHVVWYHFMVGMYGKNSTTELNTLEWTKVEEAFTLFLKENYGLQTDYPSEESTEFNKFYNSI